MNHTLGPWSFVPSSHQREWHGWIEKNKVTIAAITKSKEDEANARLIAAAPDLLENLADLLNACDRQAFNGGVTGEVLTVMEQARAVIIKLMSAD